MAVGIKVGNIIDEVGTSDFLHAFFSTVSGRLEESWGSSFPALMQLYGGSLLWSRATTALAELDEVRSQLAAFAPDKVIWDIENRAKMPPWGRDIAPDISSLANYFVTSTGRDLIDLLKEALEASRDEQTQVEVVTY